MAFHEGLKAHLQTGATTVARAWALRRADGTEMGFTDHDRDLSFEGLVFRAGSGMSASALQQGSGLAVDNAEAVGALSDAAVTEADIAAGRYDGAEVRCWLVNWADVVQRQLLFRGTLGEIARSGGAFKAELRGLTEALNRPVGRVFQKPCPAVLGDGDCRFDLTTPGYAWEGPLVAAEDSRVLVAGDLSGFDSGWFTRGLVRVLDGAAQGLSGTVKRDAVGADGVRRLELWTELRAPLAEGDVVRIVAGCDKRFDTCRFKFNNALNFQGFPDIPEEDWVMLNPGAAPAQAGGSRR